MKFRTFTVVLVFTLSASLTSANEVSMSLEATVPQILPTMASRCSPPNQQLTLSPLWLPPKHTDVIIPLGTSWPLPPLILTKTISHSASPETFTSRVVGQILYVKPESIAAHP